MENKPLDVEIYSRGEAARPYLNDKLIGEEPANLIVPYAPEVFKSEKTRACSLRVVNSSD